MLDAGGRTIPVVHLERRDGRLQVHDGSPSAPRRETVAQVLLRQRARAEGRGELRDAEVDAEVAAALRANPDAEPAQVAGPRLSAELSEGLGVDAAAVKAIAAAVAEQLREPQAPRISHPQGERTPSTARFADYGSNGAEVRKPDRDAVSDQNVRTAVDVATTVRGKGLPKGEPRWTLEALTFAMADWWPQQPAPRVRTLQKYVRKALRLGLLEPLHDW